MLGTITLTVGQTESVSAAPKEEAAETMGTIQNEVAPHVNGEKEPKECPNGSEITAVEEKAAEEKPGETNEVGFKKIFRFAGFKFTLKKDKSEEKNPVKLLTVKDKEEKQASKAETDATAGEEVTAKETEVKVTEATEEAATSEVPAEEATAAESKDEGEQVAESSPPPPEAKSAPAPPEPESAPAPPEPKSAPAPPEPESAPAPQEPETAPAAPEPETTPAAPKAESTPAAPEAESDPAAAEAESDPAAPEAESDPAAAEAQEGESSPTSEEAKSGPSVQEAILSPFRKLFTGGLFSNLRKKNSIKEQKEKEAGEGEAAEAEETAQAEAVVEDEKAGAQQEEAKEEAPASTPEEVKPEAEVVEVTAAPDTTDEPKPAEEAKPEEEVASAEVATEAEILSSQEKAKAQGSPLKKLFTGAGLKKLSTKKSKPKKDAESKLTETGEQTAEQLQSSTEVAEECKKPESGASSPEDSGEHVIAEDALQAEQNQEVEGEVTSDSEKKKEGIIPWSSFKKMVTPKRRVKKASDSEDEASAEKAEKPAKSATLSSTESAVFTEKATEEEVKEEKEDKPTEEEPQTETTEKLEGSTEESKKKLDTSVSWEALMCMGGAKKRTRKTSDSDDDDETKIEEETPAAEGGEEPESKPTETAEVTTQETETEGAEGEVVPEPEPVSNPPERETAWAMLKRLVMPKLKAKTDEKTEENTEQTVSETEMPKEESAFSLRKFLPGRRKKKVEKQSSTEVEEDSDTPAVVPLSEYDAEPAQNEEEPPVEAAITQTKVSAEDRSPSWIPATVEDDDKQLSDIPEEAENAATPKSADTTIAEDVIEKLSTAEEKTQPELPVTDTTPIEALKSETAEMVLEAAADQVSAIPCQTSVSVEASPVCVATAETEHEPPTEQADSETKTILEAHELKDAVRICTGLGTKEIAKVKAEKPLDAAIESVPETTDPVCTMLPVEDKPPKSEAPVVTEVPVFVAEVNQVIATEHIPAVEKTDTVIETATESEEPDIEIVAVVSSLPQQSEAVQPSELSENSPKVAIVSPITPTVEAVVCSESVEVIEPDVETKEIEVAVEVAAAIVENAPLKEIAQAVSQEIISAIPDTLTNTTTEVSETAIPVAVPVEEVAVIHEAAAPVTPLSENVEQLETKDETALENVPILETVGDEPIQVQETTTTMTTVVESEVNDSISAATYEVSTSVVEHTASVVDAEPGVEQVDAIEEQSMVIAQAVIKHAMTEVKEAEPEHKDPTTSTADVQSPVQALSTTEENVELQTEEAVITDTPVPVTHETSAPVETPKSPGPLHAATEVIVSAVLEVAESIDAPTDGESKSAEGLEEAVEVEEREAIVEEVVELNTESQPNLEEDQSKVVPEDVKETSEEVIPKPEETKAEETKEEETKTEEPKVEEHKAEEPKAEEPKAEEIKEETKAEETMAPETNAEVTKADDTKAEETNTEETKADETTAEAPAEEKKEEIPEIHIPTQVVLQEAHVVEAPMATEESVVEFDSNGPVNGTEPAKESELNADSSCDEKPESDQLPTQPEETQTNASTEPATSSQEVPAAATATSLAETEVVSSSGKCAEVMAQVIEVIEEAVKEIEPVSTELTAAS